MLHSMTGFARASAANDACEVEAEIRAVNHRYLEIRVRVQGGSGLSSYEKRARDRAALALSRGKVDINLYVKSLTESSYRIELDSPLMKEFVALARSLGKELDIESKLSLSDLVGFSPAFQVKERVLAEGHGIEDAMDRALDQALDALEKMRTSEGAEMAADLDARIHALASTLDEIEKRSTENRESRRADLEAKVQELLSTKIEPTAVASEVARLVERADIAEEITRFRSHVTLWRSAVSSSEPCGKKLDFIVQEMNREVNTIGSKSPDAEIAERVIGMKSELERVREQVQNVE
ncbi:MAG: YicC/YloC family endoribonuclease [Vicinamibacteria bacterium]